MTEEYDEGPIIQTETYRFSSTDTYVSIRVRVYHESLRLMADTVKKVLDKHSTPANGQLQGDGECFRPIPDEKMQLVLAKVADKSYQFMREA